jgi:hypothetical protein
MEAEMANLSKNIRLKSMSRIGVLGVLVFHLIMLRGAIGCFQYYFKFCAFGLADNYFLDLIFVKK